MRKFSVLLFSIFFFISAFVQAQSDSSTLSVQVTDLLARMPAAGAGQSDENMQMIAAMGAPGLEKMIDGLAARGLGDNTALEYALSAFSHYAVRSGNDSLRGVCVDAYCKGLEKTIDKENKAFLIRQLQVVGNDRAVNTLKAYLADERLCDPAARALVKINSTAARQALLDALTTSSGNSQLSLVEALGDIRYKNAAASIAPLAASDNKGLRKLALYSLARIADPGSEPLMASAAEQAGYRYDETGATQAYLDYAARLNADGNPAEAVKIANALMQAAKLNDQVPARTAALKLLTDMEGAESVQLLTAATEDSNLQYRAAAFQYASRFTDDKSVAGWLNELSKAPDESKPAILGLLGNSGNRHALDSVMKELKNKNGQVRIAAVKAAGQIGGQDALPALLDVMKSGGPEEIAAVSEAIRSMKGPDVVRMTGNALSNMPPPGQVALLNILAARSADSRLYDVMPLLKSPDTAVSKAAYASLEKLVRPENLPLLINLLVSSPDSSRVKPLQAAVNAAASGISNKNRQVSIVVAEMNKMPSREAVFYPVLAGIGSPRAMNVLMSRYDNGNDQTKKQVVEAMSGCTDTAAAMPLLQLSRKAAGADYADQPLSAYIRLSGRSFFPPEQRLLMLRNAMVIASRPEEKLGIMELLRDCKTYPALMYAGQFLDDSLLQQDAAQTVMRIALSNNEWNGQPVVGLLQKSAERLSGPDAEYERQAISRHLAQLPAGEGFVSLFNGKDLSGWKGLVGNPLQRAGLDSQMLAGMQALADGRMRAGWSVQDGELVFSGKGDNLCTEKQYGDFEMFVDWKINKNGDAGIYLRGSPQVQIWDTSRLDVGAQVGSGGLYNNQVNPSKPLALADNAIGEWNNFHIIMKGDRVTVYLNGVLVVNNVILENYWDRSLPIFAKEQIELQAHGNLVYYRDIYLKEIPEQKADTLSDEEKQARFKLLFDGTNMHEWIGNTAEYVMEDGNMVVRPEHGEHGNLYTRDEYSNFVFRFEFQLTPGANNGIGIRAPLEGDAAYTGMEIQVLDNEAPKYKDLHPYQYHGSVYGVIPASRGFLKPLGEWNSEEISAIGSKIRVTLNGTIILDGDIAEASKDGTADGKDHPGLKRTGGHIGFLGHGDVVRFRNVRVQTLPD